MAPHRKSIRASILALFLVPGLAPGLAQAGPWVDPKPGHGYVSLGYQNYNASEYFTGPGETPAFGDPYKYGSKRQISANIKSDVNPFPVSASSKYTEHAVSLYGEVSLYGGLGLVLSMPVFRQLNQSLGYALPDPNGGTDLVPRHDKLTKNGVGDLVLGLKYQLPLPKKARGFALGPQVYITAPTGDQNGRGNYPKDVAMTNAPLPLPTGIGTVDIETRLSAGYSFYPIPVFIAADLGYHHHFNDSTCNYEDPDTLKKAKQSVTYSDDLPWNVQVGATYAPKKPLSWFNHVTFIAVTRGVKSLENGFVPVKAQSIYLNPCGQANNMSYVSLGAQVMLFPIKQFGIVYSIDHALWGGNTGYGLTQMVALASEF